MASRVFITAERVRQPIDEPENREPPGGPVLLGESVAARRLRSQVRRIAPYFRTALIRGEAGAGKELVARCLHAASPGAGGPFVVAQAAVLAEALARSEAAHLAENRPAGSLLDAAHSGTLYLRGVGELSFGPQAALLRFLRACEGRHGASAGHDPIHGHGVGARPSSVRVLFSSDRDLRMLSAIGQFLQDLYAHVSAVEILVPPLRQRLEDIPAIGEWLLRRLADQTRQSPKRLTEATNAQLEKALWPNNLHALERVVCQAAALAEGDWIEPRHLLALVEPGTPPVPVRKPERLHDVIQQHVLEVLGRSGGNKLRAAERLGISRSTLYRMLDAKGTEKAG